ncbi:MAG: hypothetical protein ABIX01_04555 [Chitinophagaceae bacterium]
MQPVIDTQRDLIEIIKNTSKFFTEPDVYKKAKNIGNDSSLYAAALEHILNSMKGIRIFERFGINLPNDSKHTTTGATIENECGEWHFDFKNCNCLNIEDSTTLTGYLLPPQLRELLINRIDTLRQ